MNFQIDFPALVVHMTDLQPHNNRVQVQYRLPVLSQNVEAHIPVKIDIRMINLLGAFHLWWIVRKVLVDLEIEIERAALVHALIGLDG